MGKVKVGALWARENDYGKYFTGEVTVGGQKVRVFVTPNKYREENEKAPDWVMFLAEQKEGA